MNLNLKSEYHAYHTRNTLQNHMQHLPSKMADDYCEQLFWDQLPIIAEIMEIPRR